MKLSDEHFSDCGVGWCCVPGIDNSFPGFGSLWVCQEKLLQLVKFVAIVVGIATSPWKFSEVD